MERKYGSFTSGCFLWLVLAESYRKWPVYELPTEWWGFHIVQYCIGTEKSKKPKAHTNGFSSLLEIKYFEQITQPFVEIFDKISFVCTKYVSHVNRMV